MNSTDALRVLFQETTNGTEDFRVMLTVGVLVALVVVAFAVRLLARRSADRYDVDRVRTVESATVTALIVAAAGVVLVIWQGELETVFAQFNPPPLFGVMVVVSLLVVAAAYGLTKVAARVVKRREPGDGRTPPSVDHRREVAFYLIQVGVYLLAALVVLGVWGVGVGHLENLLVGAGFLGIVLGLAARQTLAAVLAGFVLLFSRPFQVGDWVVVGDQEGVVTEITVFNTRLRTFDDEHVMIPNDRVTSRDVINRSREGRLRVTQEVGVDYEDDVGRAVEVAREAIGDCEVDPLLSAPAPQVVAKRFGDSSVVLELRYWITTPTARRMWRTRTAVTEAVKEAFEREGIAIPFPQRTLSGRADDPVGVEGAAVPEGAPPPEPTTDDRSGDGAEPTADGED